MAANRKEGEKKKGFGGTFFWSFYFLLCFIFTGIGAFAGLYYSYSRNLPRVSALEDYRPDVITEIYADNGEVFGRFAIEKRVLVTYEQIPEKLKQAIIAAEDKNFFSHPGLDFFSMLRAAIKDLMARRLVEGASTLTQQLSRLLFLRPEKTFDRKFKEALLAMQIERHYTKEQIFTLYCNQIYMGHGHYGVAAAADFYFGKKLDELTVEEAALLAALAKSPIYYSPILNPGRALLRRNYVLERMADDGYISKEEAERLKKLPIKLKPPAREETTGQYFVEWVRRYLEERYETDEIWRKGLRVHTTLNLQMQQAAERALRRGLEEFDRRKGWRGPIGNILNGASGPADEILKRYEHEDWKRELLPGDVVAGLVVAVGRQEAKVRIGSFQATVGPNEIKWTGAESAGLILKRGDLAHFRIQTIDRQRGQLEVSLAQIPEVEGALVCIDNATGAIKAMVGGYDYNRSKFNRATQALRQVGSAFKPFVYAAALELGYRPDDTILDAPVSFSAGNGRLYSPNNYDRQFKGLISLRRALAESRNVPAIRLASHIGIQNLIRVVRRFGITARLQPYLPLALGASEITLLEMTSAFTTFPNGGVQARPFFVKRVEAYDGTIKEESIIRTREVISPEVADMMVELLRGVVEFGTATRAKELKRPVAGKTGTTNDYTDAWFIGFTPSLTCGVWVGYDTKRSLGEKETGGRVALPIWIDFLAQVLKDKPVEEFRSAASLQLAGEVSAGDTEAPTAAKITVQAN